MKKKSNKLTHAAHIKRHTEGTSNEISFSVLDAAKNALEQGKELPTEEARRFGRINLFTLPFRLRKPPATPHKDERAALMGASKAKSDRSAPPQTPPLATPSAPADELSAPVALPESKPAAAPTCFESAVLESGRTQKEEISYRKGKRRRAKVLAAIACILVVALLAGAGIWYLYNDTTRYQHNKDQLDQAAAAVRQTDDFFVGLDEALDDPMGATAATFLEQNEDERAAVKDALSQAQNTAAAAAQNLRENFEREAADAVTVSATSRLVMLEEGWSALEQAQGNAGLYQSAETMWHDVVTADELARQAAEAASGDSTDAINSSNSLSEQAQAAFQTARESLDALAQQDASIDWSSYYSYIDKRLEAIGYAIASNNALLARNTAEALAQNDAYNQADQDAVAIAETLPSVPSQLVLEETESKIAGAMEAYDAALDQASTSDAFIRDYLGSSAK